MTRPTGTARSPSRPWATTIPRRRETLAKVLAQAAEDASWVFSAAVTALRKLFGEASLEPDYLVLRSGASANDASEVEEA